MQASLRSSMENPFGPPARRDPYATRASGGNSGRASRKDNGNSAIGRRAVPPESRAAHGRIAPEGSSANRVVVGLIVRLALSGHFLRARIAGSGHARIAGSSRAKRAAIASPSANRKAANLEIVSSSHARSVHLENAPSNREKIARSSRVGTVRSSSVTSAPHHAPSAPSSRAKRAASASPSANRRALSVPPAAETSHQNPAEKDSAEPGPEVESPAGRVANRAALAAGNRPARSAAARNLAVRNAAAVRAVARAPAAGQVARAASAPDVLTNSRPTENCQNDTLSPSRGRSKDSGLTVGQRRGSSSSLAGLGQFRRFGHQRQDLFGGEAGLAAFAGVAPGMGDGALECGHELRPVGQGVGRVFEQGEQGETLFHGRERPLAVAAIVECD